MDLQGSRMKMALKEYDLKPDPKDGLKRRARAYRDLAALYRAEALDVMTKAQQYAAELEFQAKIADEDCKRTKKEAKRCRAT